MFIMAEKKEIRVEKKEESKIKKAWNKIKKPLATGILAGGLLLSPVQKAESVGFDYARPPPYYASELIEKDKDINVRLGWMAIKKIKQIAEAKRPVSEQKPYFDMAVNYFKRAYEKNKTPENFYLYCHTLYQSIQLEPTYESTEEKELEVIKLIEERLKEQPNDMDFIDLKQIIYYNLAIMYYRAAVNFDDVRGPPSLDEKRAYDPSKKEFYKNKAIEYMKKWLEYNEWMNEYWDEFEFFAWRKGYEEAAKEEGVTLKQYFEKECKESLKNGNKKREEELNKLLENLDSRE
jgi:tetratricopeptide (TPR) repeat protein